MSELLRETGRRLAIPAIVLLAVWAVLYTPSLRTSPAWYGDETLTLMIGRSLFQGEGLDRALRATFWHPSYSYQPGYAWLAGAAASLTGGDIAGARALNALLALFIALTLLVLGRRPLGGVAAFFGAAIFLTYSQSVVHFRWIYPHNAVALGFAITLFLLMRRSHWKTNLGAGLGLAIAAASHPLFVHGALAAWLGRIKRPPAWFIMAIPPFIVLVAGIAWTLMRQAPHLWVFDDMKLLAGFYQGYSREHGGGWNALRNVWVFFTQDFFHIGAFVSAILCCTRRRYQIALFLAVVSGLLLQNRQNLPLFYYQAVVFLPVMALAWAGAFRQILCLVRKQCGRYRMPRLVTVSAFCIPAVFAALILPASVGGRIIPRNQPWVTQDVREVEAAAAWINQRTSPEDLVIAHQNIGWLLHCRTVDLMQATAWSGRPTFTFESPLDPDRFAFPADVDRAKFLVLADIDQRWTLGQPNVEWVLNKLESEKWRVVWQAGNYVVVENPNAR